MRSIIAKSPPEEKCSPAPRTSTARTAGKASTARQTFARSRCMASVAEFCRPSFAMTISSTPSAGSSKLRPGNPSCSASSAIGDFMDAHHRQHVIGGDRLAVLVLDLGVPGHLAPALVDAQELLPAGEPDPDPVAGLHRLHEAKRVEAVIAEHRAVVRVDEESRGGGDQEIAVRDAAAEQGIPRRVRLAHV